MHYLYVFLATFIASVLWQLSFCKAIQRNRTIRELWSELIRTGSLSGFPTYHESVNFLESAMSMYPDLLKKIPIGVSYENRVIFAYRLHSERNSRCILEISHSPDLAFDIFNLSSGRCRVEHLFNMDESLMDSLNDRLNQSYPSLKKSSPYCPKLLLTALHHAREPASLMTLLYFLQKIIFDAVHSLEGEHHDAALYLLKQRDIILVPFINPDGYIALNQTKFIRKNRRPTCLSNPSLSGVDLNRNYGFHFAKTHNRCDREEYEGEYPFSEPETQALRCLVFSFDFNAAIHLHAYGNVWTKPFNCCKNKTLPFNIKQVELNGQVFSSAPEASSLAYETSGEADDWFLYNRGIISMSPEVGPVEFEFWPPPSLIQSISHLNYWPIFAVAMKTGLEYFVKPLIRPNTASFNDIFLSNEGFGSIGYEPLNVIFLSTPLTNPNRDPETKILFFFPLRYGLGPQQTLKLSLNHTIHLVKDVIFVCVTTSAEKHMYCHCGRVEVSERIRLRPLESTQPICSMILSVHSSLEISQTLMLAAVSYLQEPLHFVIFIAGILFVFLCFPFFVYGLTRFGRGALSHTPLWRCFFSVALSITSALCCCPYCIRLHRRLRSMSDQAPLFGSLKIKEPGHPADYLLSSSETITESI